MIMKTLLKYFLIVSVGFILLDSGYGEPTARHGNNWDRTPKIRYASFVPDTSVNQIFLLKPESVKEKLGNLMPLVNENSRELPFVLLLNEQKTQYLKLIIHPGSVKNSVSQFEIGKVNGDIKSITPSKVLKTNRFISGKGIHLGMSKSKVIELLGEDYTTHQKHGHSIIIYRDRKSVV